jgi:predicted transcriptional regulator
MANSTTLTVRLSQATKDRLDTVARSTKRSQACLESEAIEAFIELNAWQIEGIEAAIREADAGRLVPHEEVVAWVRSWQTGEELPRPQPKAR